METIRLRCNKKSRVFLNRTLLRTRRVFLFLFIIFPSSPHVRAEENLPPPRQEIVPGERLVYAITWLRIPVGKGELWVKEKTFLNGREVFHVVGTIETNKVLRKIFPMQDEAHSWIDAETLESLQFEKKIDELLMNTHERMVFDSKTGKGYWESFKTGKKSEFKVTLPAHDVLSAFFWVRRNLAEPDRPLQIAVTADQKAWRFTASGFRMKTVKIRDKKINTLYVEPVTYVDGKKTRGTAWFNLSADASRKPVKIIYKAPFGKVVGTLVEPKNTG